MTATSAHNNLGLVSKNLLLLLLLVMSLKLKKGSSSHARFICLLMLTKRTSNFVITEGVGLAVWYSYLRDLPIYMQVSRKVFHSTLLDEGKFKNHNSYSE